MRPRQEVCQLITSKDGDQSSMADAYLPEHILHQIFLQMPTKPLVQLKCLSKLWNHQISDPNFMKSRSRPMIFLPGLPFHAIDSTGVPSMIKLFSPEIDPKKYKDMSIVGSFNGIILLVLKHWNPVVYDDDDDMFLYNPFTGEFKQLPHSRSFDLNTNYVYGFGYGDDLTIVRLKDHSSGDSKSYEVFNFKNWKRTEPFELLGDYLVSNSYSGVFANGFLYWNVVRTTQSRTPLILALDIKKMVFSEIAIPEGCCFIRLGKYNGRVCMLCSRYNVEGFELLVMNEHEFGKSWSTILSFTSSFSNLISYASALGMVCILDDGKLLILHWPDQHPAIYDILKDSYVEVKALPSFVKRGRLQSLEHVESSISPSDICFVSI